jgi:hypothetical protein
MSALPVRCLAAWLLFSLPAAAQAASSICPLPGQKPMLLVKMYFGQDLEKGQEIPEAGWDRFVSQALTPRFPDGLTVYGARGQWTDAKAHRLVREHTRVVEIAATDTPAVRAAIADVARDYRVQFHQQAVGIVTSASCAAF